MSQRHASATSRRFFLQALGLSSLFLPSLAFAKPGGGQRPNRIERRATPNKLLIYFMTQGTYRPNWTMNPQNAPLDRPYSFALNDLEVSAFSRCLEPLYPVRQHLCLLDGVSLTLTSQYPILEHHSGHALALSGSKLRVEGANVTRTASPSIDQILAAAIGKDTPLPSLNYGRAFASVSHDAQGYPIPQESDALAAFGRLFPGKLAGETSEEVSAQLLARRSVLDRVAIQTRSLAARVSADDRRKLEAHHDLIRDLENQLSALAKIRCEPGTKPTSVPTDGDERIEWNSKTYTSLAIRALACGLTRVATVYDSGPDCTYLKLAQEELHRDVAHFVDLDPSAGEGMTAFYRYHAQTLQAIIAELASTPDGEGTLLDSTLVYLANELGSPAHDWAPYPIVLAGAPSRVKNGTYHYWPADTPIMGPLRLEHSGPAHNRVLSTIAQAFGVAPGIGESSVIDANGQPFAINQVLDEILR